MIIQFEHTKLWDSLGEEKFNLAELKEIFSNWQKNLHGIGWNALFVENHDITRIVSRWGDPEKFRRESATSIAAMYFLMQGSPFIYQGQEIGMTNTVFNGPDDFQDVFAKNHFAIRRSEGATDTQITKEIAHTSRDNARTPMQWNADKNAGFSSGTSWLKVNPNYQQINVETESKDPQSILNFYKNLIRLRRENKIFIYGSFDLVLQDHLDVFAYSRKLGSQEALVICNLKGKNTTMSINLKPEMKQILANYQQASQITANSIELKPFECVVYL